jgi:phenylacetate-CoA ligase
LSDKDCKCGHGLPLLEKVVGRITGNFKNKLGDYISGGLFFSLFYFIENIKQFQVIQETIDYISINLVVIDKTKLKDMDKDFKEINQIIWKAMGNDTKIKYNIVDEIKPSPSGKYLQIFSQIEH